MKNALGGGGMAIILSACSARQCLAFAVPALVGGSLLEAPSGDSSDVLAPASSPRWSCSSNPRRRPHQRRPRPPLRVTAEEGGGVAESGDEAGDGNVGARPGLGMGLDGEWQVKSGQGKKARAGEGVGSNPGQLPEKTRDGQDWAEWAREWREDPQGKADRLVGQWEADAKEAGGSQGVGKSKKRSSKKSKKKGSAGPSRGVVGSGFGGAARPTKSVPKGLVVAETGPGAGDVVDWSTGQQLAESDRRENMTADWQQDAKHLESLDPSDREKLAEKLRMALGKKNKTKRKAPSGGGDGRGFSGDNTPSPSGGKSTKNGGGGDGRGALASAAAAAGAVVAGDVAGVSVFPSVPAEAPAAAAAGGSDSGGESLPRDVDVDVDVAPVQGESKSGEDVGLGGGASVEDSSIETGAGEDVVLGGGASVGDNSIETAARNGVETAANAAMAEGGEAPRDVITAPERKGREVPLDRVMGFGRGVAVVETSSSSSSSVGPSRDEATGPEEGLTESSGGEVSVDDEKLSKVRSFGRGVAMPTNTVVEGGTEEGSAVAGKAEPDVAADDARLSAFGRGVAYPVRVPEAD